MHPKIVILKREAAVMNNTYWFRAMMTQLCCGVVLLAVSCSGSNGEDPAEVVEETRVTDGADDLQAAEIKDVADASDGTMPVEVAEDLVPETVDTPDLVEVEIVPDLVEVEIVPPCQSEADCADDDFCTVDKCIDGQCLHQDKNCGDGNKCTLDTCDAETGLCVNQQDDCEDGDPCTWDSCMPQTGCKNEPIPDCCPGTVVQEEDFEDDLTWEVVGEVGPAEGPTATWQVSSAQAHTGEFSLYFGNLETMNYDVGERVRSQVESPQYQLSAEVGSRLSFWLWMDAEGPINYDTFTVFVVTPSVVMPIYGKKPMFTMQKWALVDLDLQLFKGQKVSFRFVTDTIDGHDNDYEGIYVDSLQLRDMCPEGACVTKVECTDNLICTEAKCVSGKCEYTIQEGCCLNLGDCMDDDPCTLEMDACNEGVCDPIVIAPPYCCYEPDDCDDVNDCTDDICDPTGICLHPPSQAPGCCEVNTDCDDGDPCTDNICNLDNSSCQFPFNTAPCDDKSKCTKNDHCIEGTCGGDDVICDDGNLCTQDLCDAGTGCYFPNIEQGEPCDDLNACTLEDVCLLGECAGEWLEGCCLQDPDCDDWDDCTDDKCTDNECLNINICCFSDEECDDFDEICTVDECIEGACIYTPTGVEGCCQSPALFDDFSTDKGWQFGPEWERAPAAVSSGGVSGNPDPGSDHTDSADNYIIGVNVGGNASTTLHDFYWATSPAVNTTGAQNLRVMYWRWLNSDYTPYMQNKVEVWDGGAWKQIWATGSSPGIKDNAWKFMDHDVQQYANSLFKVRFGFTIGSGGVFTVSGWNVDDVIVVDFPGADGTGLCCDHNSTCEGMYPDFTCQGGTCAP